MEAHIDHRNERDRATYGEYKVERQHLAEKAVDQGGERGSADARRLDKSEYCASVRLWEREHHRGVEDGVSRTIEKSCKESKYIHRGKMA